MVLIATSNGFLRGITAPSLGALPLLNQEGSYPDNFIARGSRRFVRKGFSSFGPRISNLTSPANPGRYRSSVLRVEMGMPFSGTELWTFNVP